MLVVTVGKCLPKTLNICVFLVVFVNLSSSSSLLSFQPSLLLFSSYVQNFVFDVLKKRTKLPNWGEGGSGNLDNAKKKSIFFQDVFPKE